MSGSPSSRAASASASPVALRTQVVEALAAVLPRHAILFRKEETGPFECDGLTAYRAQPLVVVLPETELQVADVLRTCHALGVPVVTRGAGTGLSGGALPHERGVTLSLARLNRIVSVDRASCTATVQCGVRNAAISEAAHGRSTWIEEHEWERISSEVMHKASKIAIENGDSGRVVDIMARVLEN